MNLLANSCQRWVRLILHHGYGKLPCQGPDQDFLASTTTEHNNEQMTLQTNKQSETATTALG